MKLNEMLGFNADGPDDRHAELLVEEHQALLAALVRTRKDAGLEQQDVAETMGIDQSGVSRIESGDRDVRLSTLRRYAFAVGAVIRHDVVPFKRVWQAERALAGVQEPSWSTAWSSLGDVVTATPRAGSGKP